jgi:hypothetical protein
VREDYENKQSERGRYRKIQNTGRSREIREVPGSEIQTGPGGNYTRDSCKIQEGSEKILRD